MWEAMISELCPEATFENGATVDQIRAAGEALGTEFPDQLVSLLLESNGVDGEYGHGLVWPVERIVADNLLFRTSADFLELYMPFDPLLFFADAGNGDQFAFPTIPRKDEVFVWDHESDSRMWAAQDLRQYIRRWMDGTLKV